MGNMSNDEASLQKKFMRQLFTLWDQENATNKDITTIVASTVNM